MNKKLKNLVVSIVTSAMCLTGSIGAITANATGCLTTNTEQEKTSFSESWSKTWYVPSGGSMTIGYTENLVFSDKDYVNGYGTYNGKHYAGVKNSNNSIEYTDTKKSGIATGKAQVEHTGTPVTYYAFWDMV